MEPESSENPAPKKRGRKKGQKDQTPRLVSRNRASLQDAGPFNGPPRPILGPDPETGTKKESGKKAPEKPKGPRGRKPKPDSERARPRTPEGREARRLERQRIREAEKETKKKQKALRVLAPEPAYVTISKIVPQLESYPEWRMCSEKERVFVYEIFTSGFDEVASYRKVYHPALEMANGLVEAHARLVLSRSAVSKSLKMLVDLFIAERKISYVPRILAVLESQAFYDPADFFTGEGDLKCPLEDLTYLQRVCIEGIDTKFYGKDANRAVTTVKLVNRFQALDKLIKYVGLLQEAPTITQNITQTGNIQNVHPTALPKETQLRLEAIFDQVRLKKAK